MIVADMGQTPSQVPRADESDRDNYWISGTEQLALMVSPRRHEIGDHLAASGPMSIKELARQIGAQPSALYHHIELMKKAGLVVVSGHRVANRKRETLYATPARRMRLIRALADPANREIFRDIVGALTRQMHRDFERGLQSERQEVFGPERNLGFFRLVSTPDAETLEKINHHLAEIAELMWQSRPGTESGGGAPLSLAWTMCPIGPGEGEKESEAPASPEAGGERQGR